MRVDVMLLPKIYKKEENPFSPVSAVELEENMLPHEEARAKKSPLFPQISVNLEDNATLIALKTAIHKHWHTHPKQQILYLSGEILNDDNKLIIAYGISSGSSVHVVLQVATISLIIACPNGQKLRVDNVDLNSQMESLRGKITAGLENQSLVSNLRLYFREKEVNWKNQLRFIEDLENGSELSTGVCLHLVLSPDKKIRYMKVDLNWTAKTFIDSIEYLSAHQRRFATLTFKDVEVKNGVILRNIDNFDDNQDMAIAIIEVGGS